MYDQPLDLRIFAVCRAVYREAVAVFFTENTVKPSIIDLAVGKLCYFSSDVSDRSVFLRAHLRRVLIAYSPKSKYGIDRAKYEAPRFGRELSTFVNLQELTIRLVYCFVLDKDETDLFEAQILAPFEPLKYTGNFATQVIIISKSARL